MTAFSGVVPEYLYQLAIRQCVTNNEISGISDTQPLQRKIGDPDKLGLAVVKLATQDEPPLRFVTGADSVQVVEDKLAFVATQLSHWREFSISTDL